MIDLINSIGGLLVVLVILSLLLKPWRWKPAPKTGKFDKVRYQKTVIQNDAADWERGSKLFGKMNHDPVTPGQEVWQDGKRVR